MDTWGTVIHCQGRGWHTDTVVIIKRCIGKCWHNNFFFFSNWNTVKRSSQTCKNSETMSNSLFNINIITYYCHWACYLNVFTYRRKHVCKKINATVYFVVWRVILTTNFSLPIMIITITKVFVCVNTQLNCLLVNLL